MLEIGKPIEREMKGGAAHSYLLALSADQLLYAVVDQRGVDVVVTIFGPDGKQVIEVDSPNGTQGPEHVRAIAELTGSYRLEVRSLEKDAKPGLYEVRIEELREATKQDRDIVATERAFSEAEALRAQGDEASLQKAIAKYEQVLQVTQSIGDRPGEATMLNNIGAVYSSLGEKQKAIDYYTKALPIFRALGERADEADVLINIGYLHSDLGKVQKAIDYYNQALPVVRAITDRPSEANILGQIGYNYNLIGEKKKALEYFNLALLIFRAIGDRPSEVTTLNNIGAVYSSLGKKQKAFDYHNQALLLSRAAGDRSIEAKSLNRIGLVYESLSELQKALDYFNRALPLSRAAGDRLTEANTLSNIGAVNNSLGEKQKALDYYNQALPIFRALGKSSGEATTLNNIGTVYESLGEWQKALDYVNQARIVYREVDDRSGEATSLNNIGAIYESLDELQKALDYYNQALLIVRALSDRLNEVASLINIGHIYSLADEFQKALDYYNRALPIARAISDRSGEASALNNIGAAYSSLGKKRKALHYYNQTLPIYEAMGDRQSKSIFLNNIGAVYSELGKKQKALHCLNQALVLRREVGDRSGEAFTLSNIGYTYELLGQKQKALGFYLQSVAMIKSLRESATIEEIKTGISERSSYTYQRIAPLLLQLGRPAQAFDMTELARARTFLDQMGNVRISQLKTPDVQLIQEEQRLASELTSLENSLRLERSKLVPSLNAVEFSSIETKIAGKQRIYEDLLVRIKLTNPEYASLRSVNTLTLPEIQGILDKETTLLSYFVTLDKTLAFIITRDSFLAVEIPVKELELINSINWFRRFANLRDSQPESLKRLYGWLIAPLRQYIKTASVGIIPHGILNYLPFAALTDGQSYFGDNHTLFYLAGASVLPFIQKKSKPVGNQMLALSQSKAAGLPVLHYADEEATAVADFYNARALTTGNAPKSEFLKRAGDYSILHIAAHARLNTSNPLFSRIWLGPDKDDTGALEVREVYNLDLTKASLVVLSACNTQLGSLNRGDDIVGLNRAFIYAGAPTVIASLWTVEDESTSYLMKRFYTHLKQGRGKAEALQAAQTETRQKYPHPYYWAAFVLSGDPEPISSNRSRTDR